jgi:hypothetical protein
MNWKFWRKKKFVSGDISASEVLNIPINKTWTATDNGTLKITNPISNSWVKAYVNGALVCDLRGSAAYFAIGRGDILEFNAGGVHPFSFTEIECIFIPYKDE